MARGKRGPALYELLEKQPGTASKAGIGLPRWWRNEPTAAADRGPSGASSAETEVSPERDRAPAPNEPTAARSPAMDARARLADLESGRLKVSLTPLSAALCLFLLLVVVGGSFYLGHMRGRDVGQREGFASGRDSVAAATHDDIEKARANAPTPDELFVGTGPSPLLPSAPATPEGAKEEASRAEGKVAWIDGYTYIVVQDFKESESQDVTAAKEFLAERGVETAFVKLSSGAYRYRLITTRGFNRNDEAQKKNQDEFWKKIQQIGKEYRKAGGRHNLEGYLYDYRP